MYGRVGECLTGYYDWASTFIIEYSENNTQFSREIQFLNLNNLIIIILDFPKRYK